MATERKGKVQQQSERPMLYIPDTMKTWPWKRKMNPHCEEIDRDSKAWIYKFGNFATNPRFRKAIEHCDAGLMAALAYPLASKEHLRTGCDLMNFFFVIEEYTDEVSAAVVRERVDIMTDALKNPHKPRPEGEHILGQMTKEFWELGSKHATPNSARHFVEGFVAYLESLVIQAEDRHDDRIRTVDEYFHIRRANAGALASLGPGEFHLNLPDEAFYHPVICQLQDYVGDMTAIDNDMGSYNKEQAVGDDRWNILTIAMHQFNMDIKEAMEWAHKYHYEIQDKFKALVKQVPSFNPKVDKELVEYVDNLGNWVRAEVCWTLECRRYFGDLGREVMRTRLVPLLPKVKANAPLEFHREKDREIDFVSGLTAFGIATAAFTTCYILTRRFKLWDMT